MIQELKIENVPRFEPDKERNFIRDVVNHALKYFVFEAVINDSQLVPTKDFNKAKHSQTIVHFGRCAVHDKKNGKGWMLNSWASIVTPGKYCPYAKGTNDWIGLDKILQGGSLRFLPKKQFVASLKNKEARKKLVPPLADEPAAQARASFLAAMLLKFRSPNEYLVTLDGVCRNTLTAIAMGVDPSHIIITEMKPLTALYHKILFAILDEPVVCVWTGLNQLNRTSKDHGMEDWLIRQDLWDKAGLGHVNINKLQWVYFDPCGQAEVFMQKTLPEIKNTVKFVGINQSHRGKDRAYWSSSLGTPLCTFKQHEVICKFWLTPLGRIGHSGIESISFSNMMDPILDCPFSALGAEEGHGSKKVYYIDDIVKDLAPSKPKKPKVKEIVHFSGQVKIEKMRPSREERKAGLCNGDKWMCSWCRYEIASGAKPDQAVLDAHLKNDCVNMKGTNPRCKWEGYDSDSDSDSIPKVNESEPEPEQHQYKGMPNESKENPTTMDMDSTDDIAIIEPTIINKKKRKLCLDAAVEPVKRRRRKSEVEILAEGMSQAPNRQKSASVARRFLFRTGITKSDRSKELCAWCHRKGHFTLKWMKPPARSIRPKEYDVSDIAFADCKEADPDTGLNQSIGTDGSGWENPEDKVFIQFLRGELVFNEKGEIIHGEAPEYEKCCETSERIFALNWNESALL